MNNDSALRVLSSFLIATAVFFSYLAPLAADPRALAKRLDIRVIQSGHSLTDPIPPKLIAMVRAMGVHAPVIARSTIPGSPMDFRWNNPPHPSLPDARATIGNYDVLVITERISLSGTMPWHKSEAQALQWFNHAWTKGNGGKGAETLLYATWVEITSGPNNKNPIATPRVISRGASACRWRWPDGSRSPTM